MLAGLLATNRSVDTIQLLPLDGDGCLQNLLDIFADVLPVGCQHQLTL